MTLQYLVGSSMTPNAQARLTEAELAAFKTALMDACRDAPALPDHVARALACIHAHLFDERLNVAFVREQCGLNNHNISCRFKHIVGLGMRHYIERQRLKAAERLLGHVDLHVLHIAWSVGYTYPETFERAFRRHEGCSPTQFRQRVVKARGEDERSRRNLTRA